MGRTGFFSQKEGSADMLRDMDLPSYGRVHLKPFTAGLLDKEWRAFYDYFRDPEIADWNGSRPLKMPLWLFKRVVTSELKRGDRLGFGILDETRQWIGTIELYEISQDEATLGIIIGVKSCWGKGYGTEAVRALLTYAFGTMSLRRIKLKTFEHNHRARKAFEKAGFHVVGFEPLPGGRVDTCMELERETWHEPMGA